jgi:urease accessory protein
MHKEVSAHSVKGRLSMTFAYDDTSQETRLVVCDQVPPLRVIRAFPLAGSATLVHMHNLSGGILGGDHLSISANIGPRATVQLTSTSATRIYRSSPTAPIATQTYSIQIREGGLLEYLPDPLIPFAGSRYQQQTHIDLVHDAGLFWWETITPGREAHGEVFGYEQLHLAAEITALGKPLAIERMKIEPQQRAPSSPTRLGSFPYFCSFYICKVGLEATRWLQLEQQLSTLAQELSRPMDISWGVSTLVAHGLLVRAVSRQGRDIATGLLAFWRAAKLALYGQEAIPPRKIY